MDAGPLETIPGVLVPASTRFELMWKACCSMTIQGVPNPLLWHGAPELLNWY